MKKTTLLNSHLSAQVASLGHTDTLVLADAGLPIPSGPQRIDLAVSPGVPSLLSVLSALLTELQLENVTLAKEVITASPELHQQLLTHIEQASAAQGKHITVNYISHEQLKHNTTQAKAVVRTGECTPYANLILRCGVPF
ncbi:D-ribose pyranase [Oceanisphaera pacifica]|uniref:D-ribose pyranase n=1 Tax=Oceanisphaera pacifica TaxID=2818389 RepID=A0ABS3NDL2_9GAMM|nr:D-ribose pyranase [Oceanisphaera pacifica]